MATVEIVDKADTQDLGHQAEFQTATSTSAGELNSTLSGHRGEHGSLVHVSALVAERICE